MNEQVEALGRTAWQIVLTLGGVQVVVTGLLGWLGRGWLDRKIERERAVLARDNETAITRLKADLDRSLSATTAALSALTTGHQAAQERRLTAVATLWAEITKVREATSPGLIFYDIYAPHEYDKALRENPQTRAMIEKLRSNDPEERHMYPIFEVDPQRPFLPDDLYAIFVAHRQILGRAMWMLEDALEKGHLVPGTRTGISKAWSLLRLVSRGSSAPPLERSRTFRWCWLS